jgi:hypothetical protein
MTPEVIAAAIEGLIKGGKGVAADLIEYFRDKGHVREASEKIDKMLRNPSAAFRTTEAIARAVNEKEPPYPFTTNLLDRHIRARRDRTGKDQWILEANWEWDPPGPNQINRRVRRDPEGKYVLKSGIEPTYD